MVSELEILQRFYQIYLEQFSDFFTYQGQQYYLCKVNNFTNDYPYYPVAIGLKGFRIVNNCFNRPISMDYILYSYEVEEYSFDAFIQFSLRPLDTKVEIIKIKESWCAILDEAKSKIGNYASRISHFEHFIVLSYYYQGLGESAISVLNGIKETKLVAGIEHFNIDNSYENLCCPSNLVTASRIKDLAGSYKNNLITIEQLESYIELAALTIDEITYLYARLLFPSEFMKLAINDDCNDVLIKKNLLKMYQNIDNQKSSLYQAWQMLCKYTHLPKIAWL